MASIVHIVLYLHLNLHAPLRTAGLDSFSLDVQVTGGLAGF